MRPTLPETGALKDAVPNRDRFERYYHSGRLEKINQDALPLAAIEYFDSMGTKHVWTANPEPEPFFGFYVIAHKHSAHRTFLAIHDKTNAMRPGISPTDTERLIYLFEVDAMGIEQGVGELRHNLTNPEPIYRRKPFVGYTRTHESVRRQGLGMRRLLAMNGLAHAFYGLPLHSDTLVIPQAEGLWRRLAEQKYAYEYHEENCKRYAFKREPPHKAFTMRGHARTRPGLR